MQGKHFQLPQRSARIRQRTHLHICLPSLQAYFNRAYGLLGVASIIGLACVIGCESTEEKTESGAAEFNIASRGRRADATRLERQAQSLRKRAAEQRELTDKSKKKIAEYEVKLSKVDKSTPNGKADIQFYEGLIDQREKEVESAESLANDFEEDASKREALAKKYRSEAEALDSGKVPY